MSFRRGSTRRKGLPCFPASTAAGSDIPLANLLLWLDASDATTITESSGSVDQWDDKSGNDNHVTQTGSNRPITGTRTLNSLNVIDFTPTQYLDRSDALGLTGNPALTIFVVGRFDSNVGTQDNLFMLGSNTSDTSGKMIGFAGGSGGYSYRFNNGNRAFGAVSTGTDNIHLFKRESGDDYGSGEFYLNGGTAESETSSGNPTNTPNLSNETTIVAAGVNTSGAINTPMNGYIAELIVYNSNLSSNNINTVGSYLDDKWNVTWTNV